MLERSSDHNFDMTFIALWNAGRGSLSVPSVQTTRAISESKSNVNISFFTLRNIFIWLWARVAGRSACQCSQATSHMTDINCQIWVIWLVSSRCHMTGIYRYVPPGPIWHHVVSRDMTGMTQRYDRSMTVISSAKWAVHIYYRYAEYEHCTILHIGFGTCIFSDIHMQNSMQNNSARLIFCIFCILQYAEYAKYENKYAGICNYIC